MIGESKQKTYCPECGDSYDERISVCPKDGASLYSYRLRDAESLDPLVGEVLDGRFRLDAMLGQGGMGAVYRGVQLSVDRKVAVKVLKPELSNEELIIQRFFREARVISDLAHPGIVNLIDFGQDSTRDLLYLVMELIDGVELGSLLRRGRLTVDAALDVVSQVCSALSEPHAREIVHRDLKPDNLMLLPLADGSVRVKVLDFGIASALQLDTKITSTGMICGTAHYMAPEQAQAKEIGPGTDIYALGVVLFELLSGQLPFEAESALQLLLKHVQVTPPSLREFVGPEEVPDRIVDLVDRMLKKDPAERPQSVVAIRDEIEGIQRTYDLRTMRLDVTISRAEAFDRLLVLGNNARPLSVSEQIEMETDPFAMARQETGDGLAVPTLPEKPVISAPVSEPVISAPVSEVLAPPPPKRGAFFLLAIFGVLITLMVVVIVLLVQGGDSVEVDVAEVAAEPVEVADPHAAVEPVEVVDPYAVVEPVVEVAVEVPVEPEVVEPEVVAVPEPPPKVERAPVKKVKQPRQPERAPEPAPAQEELNLIPLE